MNTLSEHSQGQVLSLMIEEAIKISYEIELARHERVNDGEHRG